MKIRTLVIVIAVLLFTAMSSQTASAMYSPTLGRFMQRDPGPGGMFGAAFPRIGQTSPDDQYADGMNLYQYVRSNPVLNTDPYGLAAQAPGFKVVPLGKRRPVDLGGGNTQLGGTSNPPKWEVEIGTTNADNHCETPRVHLELKKFEAEVSYWWSNAKSKNHEEKHVEIFKNAWDALYSDLDPTGRPFRICYCPDRAEYEVGKLRVFAQLRLSTAIIQQYDFDSKNSNEDPVALGQKRLEEKIHQTLLIRTLIDLVIESMKHTP